MVSTTNISGNAMNRTPKNAAGFEIADSKVAFQGNDFNKSCSGKGTDVKHYEPAPSYPNKQVVARSSKTACAVDHSSNPACQQKQSPVSREMTRVDRDVTSD